MLYLTIILLIIIIITKILIMIMIIVLTIQIGPNILPRTIPSVQIQKLLNLSLQTILYMVIRLIGLLLRIVNILRN